MSKIRQLIDELRLNKCSISLNEKGNIKLIPENNSKLSKDLILMIKENKSELTDYLKFSSQSVEQRIEKISHQACYSISDAQRRLWILSQFDGGSVAYNMPESIYLNQGIGIDNFRRAIDATIDRHEILRTVFREDASGEIRQWVLERKDLGFSIDYRDFRGEVNKKEKADAYIAADAYRAFDLENGPLLRAALLQIEEEEYLFYFNIHHIISDAWSMEVLSKDVWNYYQAYQAGKEPQIKKLRIQYKDYSAWQLAQNEEAFKVHKGYWLDKLSGELPLLDFPNTKQRPKVKTYNGQSLTTYLDKATTTKLKKYIQENGGSLFMGLLASWNVLIYRYTSQKDIIVGIPVAGRDHGDLEDQIGFYVNTLALRNEVNPDESFDDFYQTLKENTLMSYSHQMYPFDRLVEDLNIHRNTSRSAVFDVMLILQNNNKELEHVELSEEALIQIVDQGYRKSKFDIEITFQEEKDHLSLRMIYNSDVYDKAMVEGLIRHYKQLLKALLETPNKKISKIDYLSEGEKHKLRVTYNQTKVDYFETTVMELFEEQAAKTPNKIALIFEKGAITFRELNERSNRLAHLLKDKFQISNTMKVGVMLERSLESVISMIAVMKTGACYVPIDHDYPTKRVAYIMADSELSLIISTEVLSKRHAFKISSIVDISQLDLKKGKESNPESTKILDDGSYVIYTSGSTGIPKGVLQTHRMMSNLIHWDIHHSGIPTGLKHLQYASFSFDASLHDLYFVLCSGGCAYIVSESSRLDYENLKREIITQEIEVISMPFSALNAFCLEIGIENLENHKIKYLISTAEQLYVSSGLAKFLEQNPKVELHNHYGPSESHVVTSYKISAELGNIEPRASIGKPISNTSIYILDAYYNLVPDGIEGELYIGGANLAIGYLNLESTTRERFIVNPFNESERLYKTGDLGRWLPDGNIEFLGRRDDQVKIRGYRVELGEIEQVLLKSDQIEEAVVLAKANESGETELIAYITSNIEQTTSHLREHLMERLPVYMVPAYFVQLEAMPLTLNGKIDKKSLPSPHGLGLKSGVEYVSPRNKIEEKLVKIWQKVLQKENIGVKDDFFVLGGHSLKAVRLSSAYQKEFSVKLTLKDLFTHTSVASHATLIESTTSDVFAQIEKVPPQASYSISDGQKRLWILSQFEGGSVAYNMPGTIYLSQDIEIVNFKRAIYATIDCHEILRTVFREDEVGEIRQWILERKDLGFAIDYHDFREADNKEDKTKEYIAKDAYQPFDLANGPLLRAALLRVEENRYVFYFNMHHIISDGWSLEVLSRDVVKYYEVYQEGKESVIKMPRIQYKDYSAWQLAQLNQDSFKVHEKYWLNKLIGELPLLDLPATKQRPKVMTYNGHNLATYLDKPTTAKLKGYVKEKGGSLFMGLLAVWKVLISRYTSQKDIIVGTPIAGRDHAELEDQIGFYVNTLILRNEVDPEDSFDNFYQALKEETLTSYNHQMYPFDRLVEELNLRRDTSRGAVFDMLFAHQNNGKRIEVGELLEEQLNQIIDHGYCKSKSDIEVTTQEIGDYLYLNFVFNPDVYDKAMVEGLIRHYKKLLTGLLENSKEKISLIDYLSPEDRHELLVTFNDTDVAYQKDKTVIDLFEEQVLKTPDHVAVICEDKKLTYREFDQRSNQLANYLKDKYDIQPDDLIGIKQERNESMIISILGVLKSGGAYVPIDPEYPQDRIDYIKEDIKCKVCLDETELRTFNDSQGRYSKEPLISIVKENHLAYVMYTSGSTGRPKGVMIEHRSVYDYVLTFKHRFKLSEVDRVIQQSSISFDTHVEEIFPALLSGASLLVSKEGGRNALELQVLIRDKKATILSSTPLVLNELNILKVDLCKLRYLISGGDRFLYSNVSNFVNRVEIHDGYGPTETTVARVFTKIDMERFVKVIGRPISNTQIYILDAKEQLQPKYVIGEICIGGAGLARGYLRQEELTKERFIPNPFNEGERLYKTGDLGRWLPDGNIEFLGRRDDQVKIRGYRVELGEIEQVLLKSDQIEEAVVLAKTNESGETELIAYITSNVEQNPSDLREHLKERLPVYMVPAYFVQLETMPLTLNGKIDKKSLPSPHGLGSKSGVEYVSPRTEIEEKLVKIWQKVLQKENIGVKDDFFVLGGHSLKAVRLSSEYQREFSVKLTLKDLFTHTSVASHATLIESTTSDVFAQIEKVPPQASYSISDLRKRLWIFNQFEGDGVARENIFLIPPIVGSPVVFKSLADEISSHFNVFGLQYKGFDENEEPCNSIEEIATLFVQDVYDKMERDQSQLNFIVGYSMGVPIAFEMAKTLETLAMPVSLIFIDRPVSEHNKIENKTRREISLNQLFEKEAEAISSFFDMERMDHVKDLIIKNNVLLNQYAVSGKVSAEIHCIEAAKSPFPNRMKEWKKFTIGKFYYSKINTDHYSIVNKKNSIVIGKLIYDSIYLTKRNREQKEIRQDRASN